MPRRILATIDDDVAAIEDLLKQLRKRIADVAEAVRVAAEKLEQAEAHQAGRQQRSKRRGTQRPRQPDK